LIFSLDTLTLSGTQPWNGQSVTSRRWARHKRTFRKDYKKLKSSGKDLSKLALTINTLAAEEPLPERNQDDALTGNYIGWRIKKRKETGHVKKRDRLIIIDADDTPDLHYSYYRHGQIQTVRDGTLLSGEIAEADLRYQHSYTYEYKSGTAGLIERVQAPAHTALYAYQPRGNQVRSLINHTRDRESPDSHLPSSYALNAMDVLNRHDYRYNQLAQVSYNRAGRCIK
jgi:mRNA-degrading endonuclease YafQ of YafQ-DinJ toxin-antitoxin module